MRDALGLPQSVLVLGGGSDIAFAVCRALVARRARAVLLAGRDPAAYGDRLEALRRDGATSAEAIAFEARDGGSHPALAAEAFARLGDVDLALIAHGVLGEQDAFERDPAAAADAVAANYVGTVSAGLALAGRMRAQGHGIIVVLSSVAGERARRTNFVYGSSMAGRDAFAQGLGDRLAGTGVEVMIVRPGFVTTKMTAGRRRAPFSTTPEAVAEAVVDGLGRRAPIVWVPGYLRWIFAVLRHLPRPAFRRLPL